GLFLLFRGLLDVDVVQVLAIDDRHAQFFGLRGIDQHTLHGGFLTRSYREERRGPRPMFRARGAVRTRAWQELPALQTLGVPTGALVLFVRSLGPAAAWRKPVFAGPRAGGNIRPPSAPANMVTPVGCGSGSSGFGGVG